MLSGESQCRGLCVVCFPGGDVKQCKACTCDMPVCDAVTNGYDDFCPKCADDELHNQIDKTLTEIAELDRNLESLRSAQSALDKGDIQRASDRWCDA